MKKSFRSPFVVLFLSFILLTSCIKSGSNGSESSSSSLILTNSNYPYPVIVDYEDIERMLDNPRSENFLLIYGAKVCSICQNFMDNIIQPILESSSNHIAINYFDFEDALDEGVTLTNLANQRQRLLNNLNLNYYSAEAVNYESIVIPILYFFVNGVTYRIHVGILDHNHLMNFINPNTIFSPLS